MVNFVVRDLSMFFGRSLMAGVFIIWVILGIILFGSGVSLLIFWYVRD